MRLQEDANTKTPETETNNINKKKTINNPTAFKSTKHIKTQTLKIQKKTKRESERSKDITWSLSRRDPQVVSGASPGGIDQTIKRNRVEEVLRNRNGKDFWKSENRSKLGKDVRLPWRHFTKL